MFVFRITSVGRFSSHNNSPSIFSDLGLLPPWHRRLFLVALVCLFVCLWTTLFKKLLTDWDPGIGMKFNGGGIGSTRKT